MNTQHNTFNSNANNSGTHIYFKIWIHGWKVSKVSWGWCKYILILDTWIANLKAAQKRVFFKLKKNKQKQQHISEKNGPKAPDIFIKFHI